MFKNSQDPVNGAFSYANCEKGGGDPEKVLPCLTANMAWSLIRFGYLEDERVQKAMQWLIKYQRFDDEPGKLPDEWPYKRWKRCWKERTCHSIIVKSFKVFTEIPENRKSQKWKITSLKAPNTCSTIIYTKEVSLGQWADLSGWNLDFH